MGCDITDTDNPAREEADSGTTVAGCALVTECPLCPRIGVLGDSPSSTSLRKHGAND